MAGPPVAPVSGAPALALPPNGPPLPPPPPAAGLPPLASPANLPPPPPPAPLAQVHAPPPLMQMPGQQAAPPGSPRGALVPPPGLKGLDKQRWLKNSAAQQPPSPPASFPPPANFQRPASFRYVPAQDFQPPPAAVEQFRVPQGPYARAAPPALPMSQFAGGPGVRNGDATIDAPGSWPGELATPPMNSEAHAQPSRPPDDGIIEVGEHIMDACEPTDAGCLLTPSAFA